MFATYAIVTLTTASKRWLEFSCKLSREMAHSCDHLFVKYRCNTVAFKFRFKHRLFTLVYLIHWLLLNFWQILYKSYIKNYQKKNLPRTCHKFPIWTFILVLIRYLYLLHDFRLKKEHLWGNVFSKEDMWLENKSHSNVEAYQLRNTMALSGYKGTNRRLLGRG